MKALTLRLDDKTWKEFSIKLIKDGLSAQKFLESKAKEYNKEEVKIMNNDFGVVEYQGKKYYLTSDATPTGRISNQFTCYHEVEDGEEYTFEMSASAVDESENDYTVYWLFQDVKGEDGKNNFDEFNYDDVDRVEAE